ncbi:ABC transporter permease subunit [Vibrio tubiashii]|uniref:ABC transporter permease subunit n=1 Tax=Vibrio tubiashii TaxID=29498 RepID=UPI001EFCE7BB|nr:ABC transporter permease subunit [Vibrio tubiashii]MCG9583372.1 ABC transporter permease subunit [Vibrio tubiashii]MCG9616966.1 ABC transporter permease subunit [Vibrio tubiashii]MCG9685433.1 ABC transporter permease subunit [Vibrio tubiashii]
MGQAEFSLRERDQKRLIKDRLVRLAVSAGGVGVLAALVLIFVYLAMMVLPLFSDAKITPNVRSVPISTVQLIALGVDDSGESAFVISEQGTIDFWSLTKSSSEPELSQQVGQLNDLFARSLSAQGLYGFASPQGQVKIIKPNLDSQISQNKRTFSPSVSELKVPLDLHREGKTLKKFTFSSQGDVSLVGWYNDHSVQVRWQDDGQVKAFTFAEPLPNLEQLILAPDGNTLYLRSGSELIVTLRRKDRFEVREIVDLSQGRPEHAVTDIDLLPGAYSVLVTHQDGLVSQWFDVLTDGERYLTHIRQFKLASELQFLLPDTYRKGFYSFYINGTVQSHYTTSEKLVMFERAYQKAPQLAAMSNNESYLLAVDNNALNLAVIDNPFPEVSLSSLWQKVWYEGYPEPEFVWQTTSASDEFEAKFSLVPIAFGTLKAAAFAMLFAIPIAVLGAIYTAYFMTPKMRRVVKPSIELMEALPTVIIGFLAGLWFAPIVESHLAAVVALMLFLPVSTILFGLLWHQFSDRWSGKFSNGWHAAILMPIIVVLTVVILSQSGNIEALFFNGDVRVYLAEHGIDFDQRNALVVGFAMGFAVIPTIFTIAEDAIFSVPKHLSDGSLALGATPWQTLIHVVLLTASPGIFSAIMMGLGRAVGETMIVLMATGNTPIMDWNILEGMRTLSATIAVEMPESAVGSSHYRILFLAALLLLVFTFAVNSLAEWVRERLRAKYRSL